MFKRILIFGFIVSIIEVFLYFIILNIFFIIKYLIKDIIIEDSLIDYAMILSLYIFSLLIITRNILIEIINKKSFLVIIYAISLIIYLIGWGEDLNSFPMKATIYLLSGFLVLTFKLLFDLNFKNLKSSIITQKS